jgi:phospholipase/carboxylesterase
MRLALEWLPDRQPVPQLLILLHGRGGRGASMRPLAEALRAQFPQAAIVAPDAPQAFEGGGPGKQWFSTVDLDDAARVARVAAALGPLRDWVRATQQRLGVGAQATAIAGFSQGAILALELASAEDGLAGRVLAFAGRYARLPEAAPRQTTLHLLHGADDAVVPADHARAALRHLGVLHGDATLDLAQGVGHELHPALIDSALHQLTHHIPHRTWRAAMGAAQTLPDQPPSS